MAAAEKADHAARDAMMEVDLAVVEAAQDPRDRGEARARKNVASPSGRGHAIICAASGSWVTARIAAPSACAGDQVHPDIAARAIPRMARFS